MQSRFGTNYRRCKDLLSLLRKNLINRYNELYESDNACSDKPEQLNLKDQTAEEEVAEICYKLFASGNSHFQMMIAVIYRMIFRSVHCLSRNL